jgi:dihydrofolate synthase / folylpolyglutamate synthase
MIPLTLLTALFRIRVENHLNATPLTTDPPEIAAPDRYRSALDFLFGRLNYERVPDRARTLDDFHLARMEALLERLGNPQLQIPTIHVAGSKGKGSTATMIAGILRAAGCRVGLFTSPHLFRYEERFLVDGACPSPEGMADLIERIRPVAEEMDVAFQDGTQPMPGGGPTFFELTTALGWLHFLASEVDVAVVEVGLGGRLDATNVCAPLVSVITSISRDHTRLLGETVEEIAAEKAGIIKPGVPVVSGVTAPGPAEVIERIARQRTAPLYRLAGETGGQGGEGKRASDSSSSTLIPQPSSLSPHPSVLDRTVNSNSAGNTVTFGVHLDPPGSPPFSEPPRYRVDVETPVGSLYELELAMPGEHQARNAAVAVMACQLLSKRVREDRSCLNDHSLPPDRSGLPDITESMYRTGLASARCPLRVEVVARDPLTVVDTAHNPASIEALCRTLRDVAGRKRWAVFASSRDKETAALLKIVGRHFDEVILTRYSNNPRALTGEELEKIARDVLEVPWRFIEPPAAALACVRESAADDDLVCVTGSFFLAAEVRPLP